MGQRLVGRLTSAAGNGAGANQNNMSIGCAMGEKQIDSAAGAEDLSIVLLGQDDAVYRERAGFYYRENFPRHALFEVAVQGATAQSWQSQLLEVLEQISTPLVVLTPDSDFLLADTTALLVQALDSAAQYQMAHGYALGYRPGSSEVAYHKQGGAIKPDGAADNAYERIALYAEQGVQAWRSVVRVEALKAVVRSAPTNLRFDAWCVALSFGLLAQGAARVVERTTLVAEYRPCDLSQLVRDEQQALAVRQIRQWDAEQGAVCADAKGFEALTALVGNTSAGREWPRLFISRWAGVKDAPLCVFEPVQYVAMPYYSAPLFEQLQSLEFLLHAWPAGKVHGESLEGIWVQQQALMVRHPNDSAESLKARYWQAFELGAFNPAVCHNLLGALGGDEEQDFKPHLHRWAEQLDQLPATDLQARLAASPSGQVLAAIAAATPDSNARQRIQAHLGAIQSPQIAFLVVDLDDNDTALQATFDSLLASGLRNFKIVVFKAGALPAITTAKDTLHFIRVTASNLVAHLNQVVGQLSSEWLLQLQAGDVLTPGGLLRLQVELSTAQGCQAICANEVQRDDQGRLLSVVRPGANLDLLRARPDLMSRHWLVRRESVVELGGFSEACPAALEFDLLLRLVEHNGIAGLAHLDEYLVIGQQATEAMRIDALATLKRHLNVIGYRGQVSEGRDGTLQIDFRHPTTPQVSILLSIDSDLEQLKRCLASIVQRTRYARYEVIVMADAASAEATAASLGSLQGLGGRVKLMASEFAGTRAERVKMAAKQAQGDYLVLMSSRCQVVTPAWIEALLNQAQRPEVGVVGCQMHDDNGLITHGGYELLVSQQVRGAWQGVARQAPLAVLGLAAVRSCQAVSADCLMIAKALLEQCAGLDAIEGADVDLCLKVGQAGQLVLWTPQAQMLNAGVPTLDAQALNARWPAAFSTRVELDLHNAVDISRLPAAGMSAELEWLAELA